MATATATKLDATGKVTCPKCGAGMRAQKSGKGWSCSAGQWDFRTKTTIGCDGVIWNKGNYTKKETIPRAATWANIEAPTDEQLDGRDLLAVAPDKRPSVKMRANPVPIATRLTMFDAGPGSAKSTSAAWYLRVIALRCNVENWYLNAFGVNAKDSLLEKVPAHWVNVQTINGFGGKLQGFRYNQYKTGKIRAIFKELVSPLPSKERPHFGLVGQFAERARDLLFSSNDTGDRSFWNDAIASVCGRFPGLSKKLGEGDNAAIVSEYLPQVLTAALRDGKTIDLTEQYARPALLAAARINWKMPADLPTKRADEWTQQDLEHLATLIRAVDVPQVDGIIGDEAQDLSLSQIVLFLAATYKRGELILIGDDRLETDTGELVKAGQAIFGWRGAFPGSLTLIQRLWQVLTGEGVNRLSLSVTFRFGPEIVEAVRGLNSVLKSAKPVGYSSVAQVNGATAFSAWLDLPDDYTALWITRRNKPLGPVWRDTLRARKQCCLRSSGDMGAQFSAAVYDAAGWYDDDGEYRTSLAEMLSNLSASMGEDDGESLAGLILSIGQELLSDPTLLDCVRDKEGKAITDGKATVGNLKRAFVHFACVKSPRVLSTVYRSKGDEADLCIVDDTESFGMPWNGDENERDAVCHVAATRGKKRLLITGPLHGVAVPNDNDGEAFSMPRPERTDKVYPIATPTIVATELSDLAPVATPPAPVAVKNKPRKGKPVKMDTTAPQATELYARFKAAERSGDFDTALEAMTTYYALTGVHVS